MVEKESMTDDFCYHSVEPGGGAGSAATRGAAMAARYRIGRISIVATAVMVAVVATVRHGPKAAGTADMELGRYLAGECMTCHRAATDTSTIPIIFGLTEMHIAEVLKAYREKALPNDAMQNVASRLSDEEIAALALYFSKTKKP